MKLPQLYDIFREKWEKYQSIFLISDTHFDDEELAAAGLNPLRGDSEEYLKVINSKIGKRDMMIHLGDVGNLDYIRRCRAEHKVLVMGNHDAGASNYKRQMWKQIFDKDKVSKEEALAEMKKLHPNCHYDIWEDYDFHSPFIRWVVLADNCLFDEVYEGPVMIGEKIILSHEPLALDWAFNIHGHNHSLNAKNEKNCFNVCPDATGHFEPIPLKKILEGGYMSDVKTVHRDTIDKATKRARKRGKRK